MRAMNLFDAQLRERSRRKARASNRQVLRRRLSWLTLAGLFAALFLSMALAPASRPTDAGMPELTQPAS